MTQITVTYGVLGEDDLINFFKESFELDYNKQQFIKPTSDFVLNIYLTLIDNFNLNLDLNHLPYLQKAVKVTYCIEELLNKCNIFDFKISDILQPKRKRTQTFVSQLVGIFLDLMEFNNCLLNSQIADEHEVNDAIEIEKAKIERLNGEIAKKKQDSNRLKPEIDKYNKKIEELKEQLITSRTSSQEMSSRSAELKKDKTQINAILSTKEYEKLNVIAEVVKLEEDLKLVTGNTFEQAERNQRIATDLRNECMQIQNSKDAIFKNLKKENIIDFKNKQEDMCRIGAKLKENFNEKENYKAKNMICLNEIENLKKKSIDLEDEFRKKIEAKDIELLNLQIDLKPLLETGRLLERDLQKKLNLNQKNKHVIQLKEDTLKKQKQVDVYHGLKEKITLKYDLFNKNCIVKLKQVMSD